MGSREDAHCVQIGLHQLAEIRCLRDCARKPGQTVPELHVVTVLGLCGIRWLGLHREELNFGGGPERVSRRQVGGGGNERW